MNKFIFTIVFAIAVLGGVQAGFADIKIKTRQTTGGQSYENLTLVKGKRQRTESMGGAMINITQCDLRRAIQLNPAAKTFIVNEFGEIAPQAASSAKPASTQPTVRGGKVVSTIDVKDTGERKQMFGMQARRLIITMDTQSSPESCSKTNSKMEIDGWYADIAVGSDCNPGISTARTAPKAAGGCQDQYEMKQTGAGKRGYPLYEKMTMFDGGGKETMTMTSEVVELSKANLDAGLFDIPDGFREVQDAAELYAVSAAQPSIGNGTQNGSVSGSQATMPLPNVGRGNGISDNRSAGQNDISSEQTGTAAKKEGTVRIGLVGVKIASVGEGLTAADLSEAVKNTLLDYLKVPNLEVVPLDGKLASAIEAEASAKDCDLVLFVTATHKKGGGGGFGGKFGSMLGSTIARTGIGHTGSAVGNIAGQIATQAVISATSVSAQMRSKDEVTLDIRLDRTAGGQVASRQFKAKAKSDGDDLISNVVEQAAQAIVDVIVP